MILGNIISKVFGLIANTRFPKPIQSVLNGLYANSFGLDLSEFKNSNQYSSLNELFTRELIINRVFNTDDKIIISPCDSFITESGKLRYLTSLQIKDMPYRVDELLTSSANFIDRIHDGDFINMYLSPKDYHRYHMPMDLTIKRVIHKTGKLYPVNFKYLNKQFNLFCENERVIIEALSSSGKVVYIVLVGALNVGKMRLSFEPKVITNSVANETFVYDYEELKLKKGEAFGNFEMGSTILLFFERDSVELLNIKNKKIKFTDEIAKVKA